ncbi:hypothetical protein KFE96_13175 [Kordiimonas sp. SCSIO 12603]|uniref:hypothetical protein n=1 Tax=Kordiimonas sp. SCSIO 12603 TaxID=2829596 RepID=UPI002102EE6F|nr:hypothetical protein [Kordiimonas sp. SCSIO 12603]UTW57777.1 hypothetical protein KFE96_13175 [Kordiimonas sp. SCSIO 12603]
MKIFYSWQSDTDDRVNRQLIREAAEQAITQLIKEQEFSEAERPELDQDTKGVLGAPSIADTIFAKIREASIFLADVTLTGETPLGKKSINSNVAVELGYAIGCQGDEILVKVMNTFFGEADGLPFDLQHRRWPLQYLLAPDCTKRERRECKEKLVGQLQMIFAEYLRRGEVVEYKEHQRIISPISPAAYWHKGDDVLMSPSSRHASSKILVPSGTMMYLRIWPDREIQRPSIEVIQDFQKLKLSPLGASGLGGWSFARNKFGTLLISTDQARENILAATQVLTNGEVWGVNPFLFRDRDPRFDRHFPGISFENAIRESLCSYIEAARGCLGYGEKIFIQAGISDAEDVMMFTGNHTRVGPIYDDHVVIDTFVEDASDVALNQALLQIYEGVFEALGASRPEGFNNFPPPSE